MIIKVLHKGVQEIMSNDRSIINKFIEISGVVLGTAFVGMSILAKKDQLFIEMIKEKSI